MGTPEPIRKEILATILESATQWSDVDLRQLLEKLPAGAYTCDRAGLITYYNTRAVEIWGREPKLGDPDDRFCGSFKLYASNGSRIRHDECWMARALLDNASYNGEEIVIERPDGRRVTALAHANPIHDASGALSGAVNVLVDISDRKRVEDSKDRFLATLAHELRNPLAPIRNAVEILRRQDSLREGDGQARWALDVIDRQSRQMSRLIEDLLDVSRIARDRLDLRRERVLLSEVVGAAVESNRARIEAEGHELVVSIPAEPIYLDADPVRIAQALGNLLDNAAKFTERGGRIWIRATRRGREVELSVRDTGIGLEPGLLPGIFEMFAQADPSRSRGGLGIGLTLVKRLVEMHGGTLEAQSDGPGQGTEFLVRLSAAPAPEQPVVARPVESRADRLRILVVDDNRDNAQSLAMFLQLHGHSVRVAFDGPETLESGEHFRPDVILLDIGLPGMSGWDVAREIRSRSWGRSALLVAVTGWGQDEDRRRSGEAGFDHHLVKPVDPDLLRHLLAMRGRASREGSDSI